MIEVRRTEEFDAWVRKLRDRKARSKINIRIERLESGNFGDAKYFEGIGELRIDHGPGYRVYFVKQRDVIVILLCGGDKSSQETDVTKAKRMAKEL